MKKTNQLLLRFLIIPALILLIVSTTHGETTMASHHQGTPFEIKIGDVFEYVTVSIRVRSTLTEGGNISNVVDETVYATRIPITYSGPYEQATRAIIPASAVYGYSRNEGRGPGPITTGGAWLIRWVIAGYIDLSDCSTTLKVWEYHIPGLEWACGPIVGCVWGATQREGRGLIEVAFDSYSSYGWEPLVGPLVVPNSNSRFEVFLKMYRETPEWVDSKGVAHFTVIYPRCRLETDFPSPQLHTLPTTGTQ
jgi:hypothetical protein